MHDSLRPQVYYHDDNIIAVCALNADPAHKLIEYLNLSHYKTLYGQFTSTKQIGPCTHTDGRTHWCIAYDAELERSKTTEGIIPISEQRT